MTQAIAKRLAELSATVADLEDVIPVSPESAGLLVCRAAVAIDHAATELRQHADALAANCKDANRTK
jgi:hypothetical protein